MSLKNTVFSCIGKRHEPNVLRNLFDYSHHHDAYYDKNDSTVIELNLICLNCIDPQRYSNTF